MPSLPLKQANIRNYVILCVSIYEGNSMYRGIKHLTTDQKV